MALGADRKDILGMVLGHALRLAIVGVGLGVVASTGAARFMSSMVYGVAIWDPATLVICSGLILLTAVAAALLPARRAAAVDPIIALRGQ